jgi:DNA polymerase-4
VRYHEQKSIGTVNTFETDTIAMNFWLKELVHMTERIAFKLPDTSKLTGCITVKLRDSDFQTETIQATIPYTAEHHVLLAKAKDVFNKLYKRRQRV